MKSNSCHLHTKLKGSFKDMIPWYSSSATWVILCCLSKSPSKSFEGCFNNMMRIFSSKLCLEEHIYILLKGFKIGIKKNQLEKRICPMLDYAVNA